MFPAIRKRALSENSDYRNLAVLRFITAAIGLIIKLASCLHYTERETFHFDAHGLHLRRSSMSRKPVMTTIKKLGPCIDESGNRGKMRLLSFYRSEKVIKDALIPPLREESGSPFPFEEKCKQQPLLSPLSYLRRVICDVMHARNNHNYLKVLS